MKRVLQWLSRNWGYEPPNDNDERDYLNHLRIVFNSTSGRVVITRWLRDVYCQVGFVPNGRCCDTAFNQGQRAFIHEVLSDLQRIEAGALSPPKDENG